MRSVIVAVVLASIVLAAIPACPCAALAQDARGCCADHGTSMGPSACCRPDSGLAPWTPGPSAAAPVVASTTEAVVVSVTTLVPSPLSVRSFVSFSASPAPVLRI